MSGRNRGFIEDYGIEKRKTITFDNTGTDSRQLSELDRLVYVESALGAGTIYLPPVGPMAGKTVAIVSSGSANNVTIKPFQQSDATPSAKPDCALHVPGGSTETSVVIGVNKGYAVLYSTGLFWIELAKDLSSGAPPATAGSVGVTGTIALDTDYIYVCTNTNTWKRVPLSTW